MELTLIKNSDETKCDAYKIARAIYCQTGASSLAVVEALTSMIRNCAIAINRTPIDVALDSEIFNTDFPQYNERQYVCADNRGFQMCLRVVQRMLRGNLPDCCYGATRFHRADVIPKWATARGYIADVDGLLFYL